MSLTAQHTDLDNTRDFASGTASLSARNGLGASGTSSTSDGSTTIGANLNLLDGTSVGASRSQTANNGAGGSYTASQTGSVGRSDGVTTVRAGMTGMGSLHKRPRLLTLRLGAIDLDDGHVLGELAHGGDTPGGSGSRQ